MRLGNSHGVGALEGGSCGCDVQTTPLYPHHTDFLSRPFLIVVSCDEVCKRHSVGVLGRWFARAACACPHRRCGCAAAVITVAFD